MSIPSLSSSFAAALQDHPQNAVSPFPISSTIEESSVPHIEGRKENYSWVLSEDLLMNESNKLVGVSQKFFEKVLKRLQSVSQENVKLRKQVAESDSKLNQTTQVHQGHLQTLKTKLKFVKAELADAKQKVAQTVDECHQNMAALIHRKRVAIETLQNAHCGMHASYVQAITELQNQLDQAKAAQQATQSQLDQAKIEHLAAITNLTEKISTTEPVMYSFYYALEYERAKNAQLMEQIKGLNAANQSAQA